MNIADPIRRRARLNPETNAIVRADHSRVTYRAFDQMIDAMAHVLTGHGLAPGQIAGLAMAGPNEFPGIVTAMALARMGVASASTELPARHLDLCIVEPGGTERPGMRNLSLETIWDDLSKLGPVVPMFDSHGDGAALCRIYGSSGTTGVPKFVALSHALQISRTVSHFLFTTTIPAIRIAGMGLGSVWGMGSLLRTFWTGGTLVLTNPAEALTAIGRYKVTSLAMAPISLQGIVAARPDGAGPIPSLTAIEVAGSLMPPRLLALTRARLCPHVVSLYGATEIEGVASAPFAALDGNSQAVGYVFNNVEIEAVDEHDRPLPAGSEGILRMRGENMAPGYFRDPETTARVFRDGWFYCGDTGAVTPEGLLTITGRVEEFINAGGNKISPRVIEDILLSVPDVTEAAAFGVPDRMGVIQIWAAIVASRTIPLADLTATCHAKLPGRAPKYIVQMQALPRNQNGKVLKEELVRYLTVNQP